MRAERRYRLIVFDWDGTLVDSAAAIVECIQGAARDLGLPVPDAARASHVIGLGLRDALCHAVPALAPERYLEFADRYRVRFRACEDTMRPFPGVPGLLGRLAQRGHRLAVATGKSRRGLDRALGASGLAGLFAATRCADETRPKPDPAMLIELLRELRASAQASLMVGDTTHDVAMALSAGVDPLAVSYGAHSEATLRALAPQRCVGSVEELGRWLDAHA